MMSMGGGGTPGGGTPGGGGPSMAQIAHMIASGKSSAVYA